MQYIILNGICPFLNSRTFEALTWAWFLDRYRENDENIFAELPFDDFSDLDALVSILDRDFNLENFDFAPKSGEISNINLRLMSIALNIILLILVFFR